MTDHFLLYFHLYLEVSCLLVALFNYKYLKNNKGIHYFVYFLLTTVFVESLGVFVINSKKSGLVKFDRAFQPMLFNVFTTIEFIFYSLIFIINIKLKSLRKLILFLIPVYITVVAYNLAFVQGIYKFHTYSFLVGAFLMVVYSCFYLYESILPESLNIQLSKQPFFWVCIGLLIFYLGSVIINGLFEYLTTTSLKKQGTRIYILINNSLNVILYGSFSIAFILCRKNKKTS